MALFFFYVTVATLISSHVKIAFFFTCEDIFFLARNLTWYFTAVYMINILNFAEGTEK